MNVRRQLVRLTGLLPLALLLGAWELLATANDPYFPPPSSWWVAVRRLSDLGTLLPAIRATAETFALALGVAVVAGSLLGLAIGALPAMRSVTSPLVEFSRTMPPPAVVPMAALLIGLGRTMAVTVVVFAAVWPIVLNTAEAVRSLPAVLLETARALHLSRRARVTKVLAPALVPGLLLGVRVATPLCVIVTLLVEMLTGAPGIGSLLVQAQRNFISAQAFGVLIVVGVFGFLVNTSVGALEQRVLRAWPPTARAR